MLIVRMLPAFVLVACGSVGASNSSDASPDGPESQDRLFMESFESYPAGAILAGQGGWTGAAVYVDNGPGLRSKVIDGHHVADAKLATLVHDLEPLPSDRIIELRFHAYAQSAPPISNNSGVFLTATGPGDPFDIGWSADRSNGNRWMFDARGLLQDTTRISYAPGGYDVYVSLVVVLDPIRGEVYGRYEFGNGGIETVRFPMTMEQFASIRAVTILEDFRVPAMYQGVELDDIEVVTVP